uniref:Uncharacterized protein n=1 Tax=Mycena chlorophos TaxID=658473 RepID=A0ABQ0KYW8_MYCCL|nr:predicted protein [Mycena chlorophos]
MYASAEYAVDNTSPLSTYTLRRVKGHFQALLLWTSFCLKAHDHTSPRDPTPIMQIISQKILPLAPSLSYWTIDNSNRVFNCLQDAVAYADYHRIDRDRIRGSLDIRLVGAWAYGNTYVSWEKKKKNIQ